MADSIFKQWEESINSLADDDFKKGVLTAIRKLKDEVYSLKVDNLNQQYGRVIRDDKRIVLSAPEIIIGDVNLGGMLNPEGYSKVIIRGNDVNLQGVGDMGQIDMRAPTIGQVAENVGIDGNEHVIGSVSQIYNQAGNISILSNQVKKDGAFPGYAPMTENGIKISAEHKVEISAAKGNASRIKKLDDEIRWLEKSKPSLEADVERLKKAYKAQREEIDELFDKKEKLGNDDKAIRIDYTDMDELNVRIEELSLGLSDTIYKYSDALTMMAENERLISFFKAQKEKVSKVSADDFKKKSTKASVSINGEVINMTSMDDDGNLRTNRKAGVNVLTNAMMIAGSTDENGSLPKNNKLVVGMRDVEITSAAVSGIEMDEEDHVVKAQYKAEGSFLVTSKDITLECVDYEIAEKKYKEKGLTPNGKITLRSKSIEANTVNSSDVEVDDKGQITKAKYTSDGEVMILSKVFGMTAVDYDKNGDEVKETALTNGGMFFVRTENNAISAEDTEGKAKGVIDLNAKNVSIKSFDLDKDTKGNKETAKGGHVWIGGENATLYAKKENILWGGEQMQVLGNDALLVHGEKTAELQQGTDALVVLKGGNTEISGKKNTIFGDTTVKVLTSPSITVDNLTANKAIQSPNLSDGMMVDTKDTSGTSSAVEAKGTGDEQLIKREEPTEKPSGDRALTERLKSSTSAPERSSTLLTH